LIYTGDWVVIALQRELGIFCDEQLENAMSDSSIKQDLNAAMVEVLKSSHKRHFDTEHKPEIKWVVELPMTDDEYRLYRQVIDA